MSAESDLTEALVDHLKAFVLARSPTVAVAWPNKPFSPSQGEAWLRMTVLPAETFAAAVGSAAANRHSGLLQIDVFWPPGEGLKAPLELADEIAAHFKRGSSISGAVTVSVNRPPSVLPAAREDSWFIVPVRVPYTADLANPS
jgi:hypothetical protein